MVKSEQLVQYLARTTQRMQIHIWATQQGHLDLRQEDGHEATWDDKELFDPWQHFDDMDQQFIDLRSELMDQVMSQEEWIHEALDACDFDNPDEEVSMAEQSQTDAQQQATAADTTAATCVRPAPADEPMPSDAMRPNGDRECYDEAEGDGCSVQTRLKIARKKIMLAKRYYPTQDDRAESVKIEADLGHTHELHVKLRPKMVRIHATKARNNAIMFQRLWWQPISWLVDRFTWSRRAGDEAPIATRRACSISALEVACIVDVITGGAFGPNGASFAEKAALANFAVKEIARYVTGIDHDNKRVPAKKLLMPLKRVSSAAQCGFDGIEGFNRRLQIADDQRLVEAIGTLLTYARQSPDRLDTRMPRFHWYKPCWQPCALVNTLAQLGARRCGEMDYEDVLPLKLREGPLQLQMRQPPEVSESSKPGGRQQPRQGRPPPRQGPCHFGCPTTYKNRHSQDCWRAVPDPSPWEGVAPGTTLCEKCYGKARRHRASQEAIKAACAMTGDQAKRRRTDDAAQGRSDSAVMCAAHNPSSENAAASSEAAASSC